MPCRMSGHEQEQDARADCTDDAFLGGALHILQPRKGFRAGIDSVMLAAAIPAQAGERAFEAGCGPGVAALCLLWRVKGAQLVGVECNAEYAALARRNARRNALDDRATFITGDALRAGKANGPAELAKAAGTFHHAFANPPFHEATAAMPSPDPGKAAAHVHDEAANLTDWLRALARMVRPKGTVTLIQPAAALPALLGAMQQAHLGDIRIAPLWPRTGRPASRVIVQARRDVKTPARLLPGLVLHNDGNAFTEEAENILRQGAAFSWEGH